MPVRKSSLCELMDDNTVRITVEGFPAAQTEGGQVGKARRDGNMSVSGRHAGRMYRLFSRPLELLNTS